MPGNVIAYSGLLTTNPVWDGHELVISTFGTQAGLAWNALGTSYREVPGVPAAVDGRGGGEPQHVGGGRRGERRARARDRHGPRRCARPHHRDLDRPSPGPRHAGQRRLPQELASVGEDVLVAPCDGSDPLFLRGDRWQTTGPQPDVPAAKNGFAWHGVWLGVDGAVIAWSTSTDAANEVGAPYVHAEVWVPPAG